MHHASSALRLAGGPLSGKPANRLVCFDTKKVFCYICGVIMGVRALADCGIARIAAFHPQSGSIFDTFGENARRSTCRTVQLKNAQDGI